jgi:hypothetical protein
LRRQAIAVPFPLRPAGRFPRSLSRVALESVGNTTGYRIVRVGTGGDELGFTRGVVEVGVNGDLERAKRELSAEFGDRIQVVAVEPPAG